MESVPRIETPVTPEKSRDVLYFETLTAQRDVFSSHYALNKLRKGKRVEEMSESDLEDYKAVKAEYNKRQDLFLASLSNLSPEDDKKVAELTGLTKVEIELSKLQRSAEVKTEATPAPGITPDMYDEPAVEVPVAPTPEDVVGEARIHHPEVVAEPQVEIPARDMTLKEINQKIAFAKRQTIGLKGENAEYWEAQKAQLLERQEAEANPDRPAPRGFMQRARDAFEKAKDAIMGSNRISGGSESVESRMSPLGLRHQPLTTPEVPRESAETVQPEVAPQQPEKATTGEPRQEREPRKASVWSWLKERGKGVLTFGLWEFHQAERFRSQTKEVANEAKALATLLQQERNLSLEEAEKEAWETVEELKKNNLDISASEFYQANKDITERKRKENNVEIEYIIKTAREALHTKLGIGKGAFKEYRGWAGNDILTLENKLAFEADLRGELNKIRDGAMRKDFINFAKLIRRNLDQGWWVRYVWGTAEAIWGFVGVQILMLKWEAIQAAKLLATEKAAIGGAEAGITAAQESLMGHLQHSIWQDLANSGVPTEQLPDLVKQVLNSNTLSDRILEGVRGGLDAWKLPSNFVIDYGSISQKLVELGADLTKLGIR